MNVAAVASHSVRTFAAWWSTELKGLVPPTLSRWLDESGHARRLVLETGGTVVFRDRSRGGAMSETAYQTVEEAAGAGELLSGRRPLQVILADEDCFYREVLIPRAARSRARDILGIEIEQSTPFHTEDIYWGYRLDPASRGGWIVARQLIAKRTRVHAVLEPLRRAGARIEAVGAQDADGTFVSLFALPERPLARMARLLLRSTVVALLLASILLAGATVGLLFHRQSVAMAGLEAEIETMEERAAAVRSRLDQLRAESLVIDRLLERKYEAVPLVTVLEEASRALPDTAWVRELQFEGASASLTGEAQSAPELINILEASPIFSQVAFVAPVTRAAGSETESFTVRLAIDGVGTPGDGARRDQR